MYTNCGELVPLEIDQQGDAALGTLRVLLSAAAPVQSALACRDAGACSQQVPAAPGVDSGGRARSCAQRGLALALPLLRDHRGCRPAARHSAVQGSLRSQRGDGVAGWRRASDCPATERRGLLCDNLFADMKGIESLLLAHRMFHDIIHLQSLSSCVGTNSCGVGASGPLMFGERRDLTRVASLVSARLP